ncbi:MAG TPA: phosphoribosyltransferase family protein [Coriobacteriia bacterium]
MWLDRTEAGTQLADELALRGYGEIRNAIVLGVPRGGVEVARQVADRLKLPLDLVVVRKIGSPGAPEFAAGAVDPDGRVYANAFANVSDGWLRTAAVAEHAEVLRRMDAYRCGRPAPVLKGRTVIVVDDGIATGLTAQAALRWLRGLGVARLAIAAPVMAPDTVKRLAQDADDVVTLQAPAGFASVGQYYVQFPQLSDVDVAHLLAGS